MEIFITFIIVILFMGSVHPMKNIPQGQVTIPQELPGVDLTLKHQVKPLSEFKFENVIKQQYDYSCGSAALATVLNYYLHENLTEHQVIQGLMQYGDARQIEQRRAFSLLDMKRFVTVLGYKGAGFTAEIEDLKTLKTPAIIPIEFLGYKHFVVFRGMYKDHVFFADPFLGNINLPLSQFESMWYQNIIFLVTNGETRMNALALRDQDLRIVSFDTNRPPLSPNPFESLVIDERNLKESYGGCEYVTINVK